MRKCWSSGRREWFRAPAASLICTTVSQPPLDLQTLLPWWEGKTLTPGGVLEDSTVVVLAWVHLQLAAGVGLAQGVAADDLYLAVVVLAGLGNVEVVHAVIPDLEAVALEEKRRGLHYQEAEKAAKAEVVQNVSSM